MFLPAYLQKKYPDGKKTCRGCGQHLLLAEFRTSKGHGSYCAHCRSTSKVRICSICGRKTVAPAGPCYKCKEGRPPVQTAICVQCGSRCKPHDTGLCARCRHSATYQPHTCPVCGVIHRGKQPECSKHSSRQRRYQRNYKRADRQTPKGRARVAVTLAVRDGRLVPSPICECGCGRIGKTHAHHEDYSRPLDVKWLLHGCHVRRHNELRHAPAIEPNQEAA